MPTTTNPNSLLWQLRQLVPRRPLTQFEADRIAELQANHLLVAAGINEPGTPSDIVIDLPFVNVEMRDDLPVSGLTNWFKPRWLILLRSDEPDVRRRFTLMHEFKHVLDHHGISYLYPDTIANDSERRAELVADYFAACLLMPKRLVKRLWGAGQQNTTELAGEFGVSAVAMRYRLQQIGLIDRTPRCGQRYGRTTPGPGYRRNSPAAAAAEIALKRAA